MKVHRLQQGSPQWDKYRLEHWNASEAPVMFGVSEYQTRNALLKQRFTGIVPEPDSYLNNVLYVKGHRFEAMARPLAEQITGVELYPVTGEVDSPLIGGMTLSASFDGLSMDNTIAFEHKMMNATLRAVMVEGCKGSDLPLQYQVQMEQQCMVSGCEKILFMATDWSDADELLECKECWYMPNPALREQIIAAWFQFEHDLRNYVPAAEKPAPKVIKTGEALPSVYAKAHGALTIENNMKIFEGRLRQFLEKELVREPKTDDDFATLKFQIDQLKASEVALKAAGDAVISQAEALDAFNKQKDLLLDMTRKARLASEKMLDSEKDRIKAKLVDDARKKLAAHLDELSASIGGVPLSVAHDFAGAIKGKRTLESLESALNNEVARCCIEGTTLCARARKNLQVLDSPENKGFAFLFRDRDSLCLTAPEYFGPIVSSRIADYEREVARKAAEEAARLQAVEAARRQAEADMAWKRQQKEQERMAEAERVAKIMAENEAKRKSFDALFSSNAAPAPAPVAVPTLEVEVVDPAAFDKAQHVTFEALCDQFYEFVDLRFAMENCGGKAYSNEFGEGCLIEFSKLPDVIAKIHQQLDEFLNYINENKDDYLEEDDDIEF